MDEEQLQDPAFKEAKREYLKTLNDDYRYSIEKFDTQALFISSGALGLSLAFLKDLVPIDKAIYHWMFITALWTFTVAILLGFIAHLRSSHIIAKRIQLVDEDRFEEIKQDNFIPRLNVFLTTIVFFGIFMLVLFVTLNVNTMSNKSTDSSKNKGSVVTTPNSTKIEELSMPARPLPKDLAPTSSGSKEGGKK